MKLLILCVLVGFALGQWDIQYKREPIHYPGALDRVNLTDCRSYCNQTNGECWYPLRTMLNTNGIVWINWTPGICICYAGFGGPSCNEDIRAEQEAKKQYRHERCMHPYDHQYNNGTHELLYGPICPCSLGYIGRNCTQLCQKQCGQDDINPRGFCVSNVINQPECFCYSPWTGQHVECSIWLPVGVRTSRDLFIYVMFPIVFIILGVYAHLLPLFVCIPKRGMSFKDQNRIVLGLKTTTAVFLILTFWSKLISSIVEWTGSYLGIYHTLKYIIDGIFILIAFIATATMWWQLRDISADDVKSQRQKLAVGVVMIVINFLLLIGYIVGMIIFYFTDKFGLSQWRLGGGYRNDSNFQPERWIYGTLIALLIVQFFATISFLFLCGCRNYRDLKKVDAKLSFRNLKFTRFMTFITIVFASQNLWLIIWFIQMACNCMGALIIYLDGIIDIHQMLIVIPLMILMTPDSNQLFYLMKCGCCRKHTEKLDAALLQDDDEYEPPLYEKVPEDENDLRTK